MTHRKKFWNFFLFVTFAVSVASSPVWAGVTQPPASIVTKSSGVSVDVDNTSLNTILRLMAEKGLFVVKGGVPGNEPLAFHFTNLTLPQALAKIMRGFNYVLIEQGHGRAPLLNVLGKIEMNRPTAAAHDTPDNPGRPGFRGSAPSEAGTQGPPGSAGQQAQPPAQRQAGRQAPTPQAGQPGAALLPPDGRTPQPPPAGAAQTAGSGPKDAGQPAAEGRAPGAGVQPPGGQPPPPAAAQPEESPGVHF
jgi:hypothetical protein